MNCPLTLAQKFTKTLNIIAFVGSAVLLLALVCAALGARVNTTKSIPVGLYWISSAPVEKGSYVLFCPPPHAYSDVFELARQRGYIGAGFCPDAYGFMMKRVSALGDDVVTINDVGVSVNGALLPLSAPIKADLSARPLPRYFASSFVLAPAEVLLMSDVSATSFDGRYFGPVNRAQICSVIDPVFTW